MLDHLMICFCITYSHGCLCTRKWTNSSFDFIHIQTLTQFYQFGQDRVNKNDFGFSDIMD